MADRGYFKPIVAFGKTFEETGLTIAEDATSIPFDNTGGDYLVGDHVFASNGSDLLIQYIGVVTVDNGAETVGRPADELETHHVQVENPGLETNAAIDEERLHRRYTVRDELGCGYSVERDIQVRPQRVERIRPQLLFLLY